MNESHYKLWEQLNNDGLYTKTYEDFSMQFSQPEKQRRLYHSLYSDGVYTKTADEFYSQFFSVKKKDEPQVSEPVSEEASTVSTSDTTQVAGTPSGDLGSLPTRERVTASGGKYREVFTEKPFIEGELGEFIRKVPWIGNDLDDWARSYSEGAAKRGQAKPAMDLLFPALSEMIGEDFNKEDYRDAAEALASEVSRYDAHVAQYGTSEELHNWNKSIQENGNGVMGLGKTIWQHKGDLRNILGQWAIQSLSTAMSDEALEKASAVQVGGMLAGAPAGPAGVAAAGTATLPFTMATLSGVTASTQFLVEELQKEVGEDFNADAILDALENEEFRAELRKNAAIYGIGIGAVDYATMKLGGGLAAQQMRTGTGFLPKTKLAAQVAIGEGAGEALGEGLASTAAGKDVTAEELFQEAASGAFNTPITMTYGAIKEGGMRMAENPNTAIINQLNVRSKYEINGQKFNKEDFISITEKMTLEELSSAKIKIEEDSETTKMLADRFKAMTKKPETSLKEDVEAEVEAQVEEGKNEKLNPKQFDLFEEKETGKRYRKIRQSPKEGVSLFVEEGQDIYRDEDGIQRPSETEKNQLLGINLGDEMMSLVEEGAPEAAAPAEPTVEPTAEAEVTEKVVVESLDDKVVDQTKEEPVSDPPPPSQGGPQAFTMSAKTGFQTWKNERIKRFQDKYIDIFNIQRDIQKQKGPVAQKQDFQMAEELMYGKAAEDLVKTDTKAKDITSDMKKAGVKVDELGEYLYALHAKERNSVIEERTKGKVENGSGMSNEEADAILSSANKEVLDPIVAKIREIQEDTRKTMVALGLESQKAIDEFTSMFENYVPLAGLATDESTTLTYPTGGAGLNTFGSTTRRAEGRKTKAEDILAQVVAQNAAVHIKARTNEAITSLHDLVKANPNSKVWKVLDERAAKKLSKERQEHLVGVRIKGEQKFIFFNDKSYAETLRGMSMPHVNAFVRAMRRPAQWLRASFTSLNPEFVISNFSRDIQSALFNAAAEAEIEGGLLNSETSVASIMKMVPQTLKTLVKNAVQKDGDPRIEKYFQEFKDDGGKTGWAYAKPLDQLAQELRGQAEGKTRTQEILGKAKNFGDFITGINDAFENSIRLAAYIEARENGISREKAAQLGKNITVNFNKQGEYGPSLNVLYLFYNASIQGTTRLGRSLLTLRPAKRPDGTQRSKVQRINSAQWMAAGLTVFSSMLTALNYAISEDDEDGIPFYDKIPDYVKERNFVIMRPDGKDYFKIPMPWGLNVFANTGLALTESAYGRREPEEAFMFLFNSFMDSFSPISFGQSKDLLTSLVKGAVPTPFKPVIETVVNETYFGSPVTGENLPFGVQKPDSELSFRSPDALKDLFRWINKATGGSEYVSGGIDINPDKFWYVFEYAIGGAGQFVNRSVFKFPKQLYAKLASDEDIQIQAKDVPMLRLLYGQPSQYFDMEKFLDNEQEFKSLYNELQKSPVEGDPNRYKGISSSMNKKLNVIKKKLKQLRTRIFEARDIENYTERTARIQDLQNQQRSLIMEWNKLYEQARK